MFALRGHHRFARAATSIARRGLSTLEGHPHIYIYPSHQLGSASHILTLLPTSPPTPKLSLGTTTSLPPTTDTFTENHQFLPILQSVLAEHAHEDPDVISQAQAMASTAGSGLGSGGVFFPHQKNRRAKTYGGGGGAGGDGAGGASAQGGMGGAGRGGWVHVSDQRNRPDFGRIAWPEDIFGSIEVDGHGRFVGGKGNYQPSGTYRILTREGILGLSPNLRDKVVERLRREEAATH
ncbi:MAG: hypothetical protein M1835_007830 [Candelina submexicana]|nr:MAG: hypothetical protein M1835_007830 [Candelina submexicana]